MRPRRIYIYIYIYRYKHLGATVSTDHNNTVEAAQRVKSGMSAFVPLAASYLGSNVLTVARRISAAWSFCMSRLVYNVHTWSTFIGRARNMINTTYNRIWRRVAKLPRFSSAALSDLHVRALLNVPSVDCYLRRRRLMYLHRLYDASLPILNILLQQTSPTGARLPFAETVLNDLRVLRSAVSPRLDSLGDPDVSADGWWHLIGHFPVEWRAVVDLYHTCSNDDDNLSSKHIITNVQTCRCPTCEATFLTPKALAQHARIKHSVQSAASVCIPSISICPMCSTDYHTRVALLAHLSDFRIRLKIRNTCCAREYVASNPVQLPRDISEQVCDQARLLRKRAHADGHTHPIQKVLAKPPKTLRGQRNSCCLDCALPPKGCTLPHSWRNSCTCS